MAWFKYDEYLSRSNSDAYDKIHDPGVTASHDIPYLHNHITNTLRNKARLGGV